MKRCKHDMIASACAFCTGELRAVGHAPREQHAGRPDEFEREGASALRLAIRDTLDFIKSRGVEDPLMYLAQLSYVAAGHYHRERWTQVYSAKRTIENILDGGSAKEWSLNAISQAILEVSQVRAES